MLRGDDVFMTKQAHLDYTTCALDALEGVVGLEHLAQRVQALHLAVLADVV